MIVIYGEVVTTPDEPRKFSVRAKGDLARAMSVAQLLELLRITKEDCEKAFEEKP